MTCDFLRRYLVSGGVCNESKNLTSYVSIVTGCASRSIGEATAKRLLEMNSTVVITQRSKEQVEKKAKQLQGQYPEAKCIGLALNLLKDESIASFVEKIYEEFPDGIDILVNNAGVHFDLMGKWKTATVTENNREIHWDINYLGTVKLTLSLEKLLVKAAGKKGEGRIVNVISELHNLGEGAHDSKDNVLDSLRKDGCLKDYGSWTAYGQSKLAVLMFSKAMNAKLKDEGINIAVNCLHPGPVYTTVADKGLEEYPTLLKIRQVLAPVEAWFLKTPDEGAETSVYCAVSKKVVSGGNYYKDCRKIKSSRTSYDTKTAQELYEKTIARIKQESSVLHRI